jgi:hypothetical protein
VTAWTHRDGRVEAERVEPRAARQRIPDSRDLHEPDRRGDERRGRRGPGSTDAVKATVPRGPKVGQNPKLEKTPPTGAGLTKRHHLPQSILLGDDQSGGNRCPFEEGDEGDGAGVVDGDPLRRTW